MVFLVPNSIYISAHLNGLIPKTQIDGHNPGQMKDGEKGCRIAFLGSSIETLADSIHVARKPKVPGKL